MKTVGIFYGSSNGTTEEIAEKIKKQLSDADVIDIANASSEQISKYDNIIFGTSTWGDGDLQDEWEDKIDILKDVDFSGKKVAFFGTGDQDGYPDTFVDAMGIIYETIEDSKATFIGEWATESYDFDESRAVVGDNFIGLVIDEDNQPNKTDDRIKSWVDKIKEQFA